MEINTLSKDQIFDEIKAKVNIIVFIEDNLNQLENSNESEKKEFGSELKAFISSTKKSLEAWREIAIKIKTKLPHIWKMYNFYSLA